ncbi:hypothetical protein EBR25_08255 [bacterium]|nr:hypothetical protein [bacterium]
MKVLFWSLQRTGFTPVYCSQFPIFKELSTHLSLLNFVYRLPTLPIDSVSTLVRSMVNFFSTPFPFHPKERSGIFTG